jgi:hypothetical protein
MKVSTSNNATARILSTTGPIKRVLYVPTAYHGERGKLRAVLQDIVYLDWQARLLGFLASRGLEVHVKPHPEGASKAPSGFAESFGFITHEGRFEDIDLEPDAYLIDYIASSTTAPILKSHKPVIFVDQRSPALLPEARELLRKRCWYIDTWDDAKNRLQIDWDNLDQALQAREHVFDMAFPDLYLAGHRT